MQPNLWEQPPAVDRNRQQEMRNLIRAATRRESQPLAEPPDPDNPFTLLGQDTLLRLHALGAEAYGPERP